MFICIICQATCRSYLNISSSFEITLNVLRGGSPSYHRYLWWLLLGVLLVSHKWAESDGVNERWYILLFPYTYLFWFFFFFWNEICQILTFTFFSFQIYHLRLFEPCDNSWFYLSTWQGELLTFSPWSIRCIFLLLSY